MSFLISKADLFKESKYSFVQLSPDATWISSVQPKGDQKTLVLQKLSHMKISLPVYEADEFLGVWWIQNSCYILFLCLCHQKGLELFAYDLNKRECFSLIQGVYAKQVEQVACFPDKVFLHLKKKERNAFDLYMFNSLTREIELFYQNNQFLDLILDANGQTRFGIKISASGGEIIDIQNNNRSILQLNQHDMMLLHRFPGLKPRVSSTHLLFVSSQSYANARLLSYDFQSEETEVLAEDIEGDITNIVYHPYTNEAIACLSEHDSLVWKSISPTFKRDFDFIQGIHGNHFQIISQSFNNQYWIMAILSDIKPIEYVVYQLETQKITPLFE